ncbi:MAG: GNAT family N-acetyltransferase [Anaerolineae bacterium]|nr:GNAT family N-acetyltransferase [Anaerolineae bacterium]
MLHTRLATPDDAAELARLMLLFDNPPRTPEQQAELMRNAPHEYPILGLWDGAVVSFLCMSFVSMVAQPNPFAIINDLFVEPAYRRRGLARALMQHAERLAHDLGASGLCLITGFKNIEAQALYRSFGFQDWALAMKREFV